MKKSIFRSIYFTVITVLAVLLVLITGVLYNYFNSVQQSSMRIQTELIAKAVEDEGTAFFESLNQDNFRITYIEPDGTVIYDSQEGDRTLENHLDREEVKQAIQKGYGESYRYSNTLLEKRYYTATKLSDGSIIRLSSGHYTLLSLLLTILPFAAVICLGAVALSLSLALRLSDSIVRPLNELNLDNPKENKAYEELNPLLERIDSQQEQLKEQQDQLKEQQDQLNEQQDRLKEQQEQLKEQQKQLKEQQKQLQDQREELKRTEQIRREFTANVSHELKTPLHSISGYAELLKDGIVREEDVSVFSLRIYGEAQRLISLVEDILRLSHLDEGGSNLVWERADLYKLAEKTMKTLEEKARKAAVAMDLEGESVEFFCCPALVEGIIFNLCDNAVKYNREKGSVRVLVKGDNQSAILTVSDSGIGILPEDHERIFERFYRVDKSHSKAVGGTGLGLSIVKHSVRLHNAKISVESEHGTGTRITVTFPRREPVDRTLWERSKL